MKAKTFRGKLWRYFALLAVVILAILWLLQTVLLQGSYQHMVAQNVKGVASQIISHRNDDTFESWLDKTAAGNSLLIFITDGQGQVKYATDEHNGVYTVQMTSSPDTANTNPYRQVEQSWQKGHSHYLSLPSGYEVFLTALQESNDGAVSLTSEDGSSFTYGRRTGDEVIYISATLAAVGATVHIIRVQLIWVTAISLLLAFGLAWFLAKRFSAPVSKIAEQAQKLVDGTYDSTGTKGFSAELDDLSDALERAAGDITEARTYQKDFLANISHDLRTPLTMIKGYAEMVRDISWRDEKKRESDLGVITREADRLTALVNDIVDFSSLDSGKMELHMQSFSFSAMAQNVVGLFASLCEKEGYTIQADISSDLMCNGDEAQLSRVLYNLIDNALTHAGEDKTILIRSAVQDGMILTEVEDHGTGIPADVLPLVWDRYFRNAERKRNKKGSGLGLAISREIIEKHNGTYGAESADGKGSTFWFEVNADKSI